MSNVTETSINIDDVPVPTNTITTFNPSPSVNGFIFGPLQRLMAYLLHPGGAFGEEEGPLMMPGSAINFLIGGLFAFVAIKAQGNTGFPFQTNPRTMKVSVSSLIMFAVAEHALSVRRPPPAPISISTVVARFGRMVSLVTLLASLTDFLMTMDVVFDDI
ncbi:hypothetical protein OSB04_029826 [Centaurea solstitialis]|uniref:Uncharacterized protein n=1 Tax=Centaurea solstitialis TaxID=347529 RepID=A0AA38SDZ3_9ASTR|nr:hypothetical protein OSB04_029826 [Centaurea solstitialis]